jgi:hypothetical protein
MSVPGFSLDLGTIFLLVITSSISFVWMHLRESIKSGDANSKQNMEQVERHLLERIVRLEQIQTSMSDTHRQLLDHIQQIQLQLARFELMLSNDTSIKRNVRRTT